MLEGDKQNSAAHVVQKKKKRLEGCDLGRFVCKIFQILPDDEFSELHLFILGLMILTHS